MKRFPGPEAPRATWNGNPVPLPTQTSTLCLNGNFSSTFGISSNSEIVTESTMERRIHLGFAGLGDATTSMHGLRAS